MRQKIDDTFYSPAEVADRLGVSCQALKQWRVRGQGPGFYRVGKKIRYGAEDLSAWLAQRRQAPTRSAA